MLFAGRNNNVCRILAKYLAYRFTPMIGNVLIHKHAHLSELAKPNNALYRFVNIITYVYWYRHPALGDCQPCMFPQLCAHNLLTYFFIACYSGLLFFGWNYITEFCKLIHKFLQLTMCNMLFGICYRCTRFNKNSVIEVFIFRYLHFHCLQRTFYNLIFQLRAEGMRRIKVHTFTAEFFNLVSRIVQRQVPVLPAFSHINPAMYVNYIMYLRYIGT